MKKILFVIGSANIGGAEVGMMEIINELYKKYEIDICFYEAEGPLLKEIPKNVRIYSIIKKNDNRIMRRIKRYLYYRGSKLLYKINIKKKYDTEIAFLEGGPAMFVGASFNKNSRKVASIRVDISNHPLDVENRIKNQKKSLKKLTRAYNKFATVYAVSDDAKNSFVQKFPNMKEKTITLRTYFDKKKYEKMAKEFNPQYDKKTFNIVSVGRFSKQKGYDRLIEIAKSLKDKNYKYKWYIVGRYSNKYGTEIINKIKEMKLEKEIILFGEKNNPYPYIKNADILVSTSYYEGFPRVVNEAIALNTIVIAPNISGVDESIQNKYGLMADNNTKSILEKIELIINSNQEKNKIYQNLKKKEDNKEEFYTEFKKIIEGK